MVEVIDQEHMDLAARVREVVATYREAEDLINIGAYVKGSNPKIDYALSKIEQINTFFRQKIEEQIDFEPSFKELAELIAAPETPEVRDEEISVPSGAVVAN
jgi:flagellum-specific ATP synthase